MRRNRNSRAVRLFPGRVGRQDQRCHLTGHPHGGGNRFGAIGGDSFRGTGGLDPAGDRIGDAFYIGGKRRVMFNMIGCMFAHDIDDRRKCLLRIMQIGKTVAEPRTKVQ